MIIYEHLAGWFGLVEWTPSRGRKVGIPRGILPHVQGAVRARLKPLFQGHSGLRTIPDSTWDKGGILRPVLS